jgi:hypothetical protein
LLCKSLDYLQLIKYEPLWRGLHSS